MKQRALIDIQMILDTRLGVLARMNPIAANAIARSSWYHSRDTDRFDLVSGGIIDLEEYRSIANKYEVETLLNSVFTDYVYLLRKDIEEIYPKTEFKGIDGRIEFDINVYPYKLLESEKEILKRAVARYLTEPAVVRVVNIAYALLPPGALTNNYDMMALYNYEDWLKYHEVALFKFPIQDFTIFYPRIAHSGEVPETDEFFNDPFQTIPLVLCEHIQLHPLPTMLACWNPNVYDRLMANPASKDPDSTPAPPESTP